MELLSHLSPDNILFVWLLLGAGFALLLGGAEILVRGSATLARRMGVSSLVVGLTIVSFGTSLPEFMVSLKSALGGHGGIAVGNVVGSNIINVALILGLCALVRPISASARVVWRDIPFMIAVTLAGGWLLWDRRVDRWEGGVLLALFLGYLCYTAYGTVRDSRALRDERSEKDRQANIPVQLAFIAGGLVCLLNGAGLMVTNGTALARHYGVSETVIGITVVAFGTSLPELAASLVAAVRGEMDIALGNIAGSNIFNLGLVMGSTGLAVGFTVPELQVLDIAVMLAVSVALFPLLRTGFVLSRREGGVLLAAYGGYLYLTLF